MRSSTDNQKAKVMLLSHASAMDPAVYPQLWRLLRPRFSKAPHALLTVCKARYVSGVRTCCMQTGTVSCAWHDASIVMWKVICLLVLG